jgi:hypothetical protein
MRIIRQERLLAVCWRWLPLKSETTEAPSRCPVSCTFFAEMVQTRTRRGGPLVGRGKRRKTPQKKKPTGWIRGTSGIRTPDGKILSKSDIKSVLLSSKEAVAKRRDITAAEYGRVWQAMPETLLSLIEEAAGGVAKLRRLKQPGGLKLLAAAAETWLKNPTARVTRRIGFEDEHAASDVGPQTGK